MNMTAERWDLTCLYLRDVFGAQDEQVRTLMTRAVAAGLPNIAVSADVGRLLMMLVSMTRGRLVLEVGTLGGYSGIWLARGLREGGKLITMEREPAHADFAHREFANAGVGDRVEIRRGAALDVLPGLGAELGPDSVDAIFLDAEKVEYAEYWAILRPTLRVGGLLMADNALGGGSWWIDEEPGANAVRDAMDAFNRQIAGDPDFEAVAVPLRQGVLIARRVR